MRSHRGPLACNFPDVPQFPLGGSLFGWQSMRTRLKLSRHLRDRHAQIAHAFDFYANLVLIPAARFARVPVVIGSHRCNSSMMTASRVRHRLQRFAGATRLSAIPGGC